MYRHYYDDDYYYDYREVPLPPGETPPPQPAYYFPLPPLPAPTVPYCYWKNFWKNYWKLYNPGRPWTRPYYW